MQVDYQVTNNIKTATLHSLLTRMKQVQVRVPEAQVDVVEDLLTNYNLLKRTTILNTRNSDVLFNIRVEDNESNELLHELKARGVGDVFGDIDILLVQVHVGEKDDSDIGKSAAANIEEILAEIEANATMNGTFIALVILSATLAALGLLDDSTVIIIGSMIVAPLLAPVALTSIGILLTQRGILTKGLISETVGIVLTVGVGYLVGIFYKMVEGSITETHAMTSRAVEASQLNILFAIVSGVAAGVIISKGQGLSIVGVAIAASLAPPAANIGLYLAMGELVPASVAATLLFVNILAINTSCSVIFTIYRLPAKAGISKRRSTRTQKINNVITIVIFILFVFLSIRFFNSVRAPPTR